jgi:hypothetical protein
MPYIIYFFFLERLFFLSSKAIWVTIDCRSKNWVSVLESLGSTGLEHYRYVNPLGCIHFILKSLD